MDSWLIGLQQRRRPELATCDGSRKDVTTPSTNGNRTAVTHLRGPFPCGIGRHIIGERVHAATGRNGAGAFEIRRSMHSTTIVTWSARTSAALRGHQRCTARRRRDRLRSTRPSWPPTASGGSRRDRKTRHLSLDRSLRWPLPTSTRPRAGFLGESAPACPTRHRGDRHYRTVSSGWGGAPVRCPLPLGRCTGRWQVRRRCWAGCRLSAPARCPSTTTARRSGCRRSSCLQRRARTWRPRCLTR